MAKIHEARERSPGEEEQRERVISKIQGSLVEALRPDRLSAPDAPVIAIIAAHPDDEVAGAGSLIPSMKRGWLVFP